ncbi:PAS-domain containing protein [Vibrio sp. JC009]|uniref:PAS-domain containing protein n=1 Tax=Vibrio sp. JC009 TaxID=2912314 RepID=UPI0023AFE1AF|nr:PAS-domain containing protein [Vibrio sp. JC009]WED23611.1 PAS-domain containing protein [Vibrio sp. JC009]
MRRKGIKSRELTAMVTAIVMSLALVLVAATGLHHTNMVITKLESKSLPDVRVALGLAEGVAQLAAFAPYSASINQPSLLDEQKKRFATRFEKLLKVTRNISDQAFRKELVGKLKAIEQSASQLGEVTTESLFLSEELLSQRFQLQLSSENSGIQALTVNIPVSEQIDHLVGLLTSQDEARLNMAQEVVSSLASGAEDGKSALKDFVDYARDNFQKRKAIKNKKQFLLVSIRAQSEYLSEFVNTYVNDIQQQVLEQQQQVQRQISQVFWSMVVMMLLLILAVAVNYGINIKTVQELTNVTNDMIRLSNGDTRKVSRFRPRDDEIGDLLNAYQVFRAYTYRIQKVSSNLEQQKQLLESIFDGMHDGLSVFSKENKLLAWNQQYLSALKLDTKEVYVGMPLEEILERIGEHGERFQDIEGHLIDQVQWNTSRHSEDRCVEWHDSQGRIIEFRSQPMTNGGFITLTQDLTYRRETEHQLQQAVKMESLGQLTGGVSHDFNNFLTSILGNLQLLEMQDELSPQSQTFVSRAIRASESGRELVHKLLAFSRKQVLTPEIVCVEELISESEDLLEYSVSAGVRLNLSLADCRSFIRVDKVQLQNALLNLTINSNGAIAEKGEITISTQTIRVEDKPWLRISVSDTGKGIPVEIQHRVFEAFFTTKEIGSGSGLGLSSVHGYVQQSGGQIGVESQPNEGTTIWMQWPVTEVQETVMPSGSEEQSQSKFRGTLVLVEDDEQVAQTMIDLLDKQAEHVIHFPGADIALNWLISHKQTVFAVLSDVHLVNSMSGVELKEELKTVLPELPVCLYSGMEKTSIEQQFNCTLDENFISKPVTLPALWDLLRKNEA